MIQMCSSKAALTPTSHRKHMFGAMKRLFPLVILLGLAMAAPIQEVEIKGADTVLAALARIALPFGVGDEPGDLQAAQAAVLASGYFQSAKVTLEGQKLVVEVVPNPPITKVSAPSKAFPEDSILKYLETEQAIGPESTFNPKKNAEAAAALAKIYRNEGFPFEPKITPEPKTEDKGIALTFNIEENPELKKVEVGEVSFVPKDRVESIFQLVPDEGRFSFERYRSAVEQVGSIYSAAGFRGSGVDLARTQLVDGTLKVVMSELRISEIVARDIDISSLGIKVGDPFNLDRILDGVNALSRSISRVVDFRPDRASDNGVRLTFQAGAQRYGAIKEVRIEGATAIPQDKLLAALRLKVGDEYNPALAQEDYVRLLRLYVDSGYEILSQPDVSFTDGVYTLKLRELRIQGYELNGLTRTNPEVVTRELPKPGSLWSVPAIRNGISSLLRTGLFAEPPNIGRKQGDKPENIIIVLSLKEGRTGGFRPQIGATQTGGVWTFEGSIGIEDTNLWGLAHQYNVNVGANTNDAGQIWAFSASYTIPWLYVDFADFKDVKTALTFGVYSQVTGNIDVPNATDWEYTERTTGLGFSISRPFSNDLRNLLVKASLSWLWSIPYLEPNSAPTTPEATARANLPSEAQTIRLDLSGTYSQVDSPRFPTQGYAATLDTGVGVSFPYGQSAKPFVPVIVTGKTYFRLDQAGRQAISLRVSAGTIFGTPLDSQKFSLGGYTSDLTALRGYDSKFLDKGTSLLSASVEYRYDFGLNPTGGTQVYGLIFSDWGTLGGRPADPNAPNALYGSIGVGVQVELDLLGALLPPIQIGIGFNERSRLGKFYFRLGPSF